jgi:hypothetical protein
MTANDTEWYRLFCQWRGIDYDDRCRECGGAGTLLYPSTTTWRGGIGGAALRRDVCNVCWGSGDRTTIWPAWSRLEITKHRNAAGQCIHVITGVADE